MGGLWGEDDSDRLFIGTLEGVLEVPFDHFIIQGVQGEIYPCRPDIFNATYEWLVPGHDNHTYA